MRSIARKMLSLVRSGLGLAPLLLAACGGGSGGTDSPAPAAVAPRAVVSVQSTAVAAFPVPWAMAFLPDGRLLVTERVYGGTEPGRMSVVTQAGAATPLTGLPTNIGMLDVALDPRFSSNRVVYMSFIEPGGPGEPRVGRAAGDATQNPAGLAVATGKLALDAGGGGTLDDVRVIWRQTPKIVSDPGSGEPGGRLAFSPDGKFLFIAAGDRQEFAPVQDLGNTLGKIVRLNLDGSIPADNPFVGRAGALPETWTLGHRNPYGLAFDAGGRLWEHEMGPLGGDELNLVEASSNYGWPNVSNGDNYDGSSIPDHSPGDGYSAPAISWTPTIAPSGMIFYAGTLFGAWQGDAIISGLKSQGLVRVHFTGTSAAEAQRIALGARIRAVTQGPDGAIWVLEDAPTGRLLKLTPVF